MDMNIFREKNNLMRIVQYEFCIIRIYHYAITFLKEVHVHAYGGKNLFGIDMNISTYEIQIECTYRYLYLLFPITFNISDNC